MRKSVSQLQRSAAAVLREVEAGTTVIVTRHGTPVAELRPIPARRFVPRAVLVEAGRPVPPVDAERFRADLDSVVDQAISG